MRIGTTIRWAFAHLLFRLARRQYLEGVDVRGPRADPDQRAVIDAKIADAFDLLREFGPRYLERIRRHADGVLLSELSEYNGTWQREARLIFLSQNYIVNPETKPVQVAATIVHEVTHAWLEALGFSYTPQRRARLEAICYRAEEAFSRRVPGCEELASQYAAIAQAISEGADIWTDEDIRARARASLEKVGVPAWLARLLSRLPTVLPGG